MTDVCAAYYEGPCYVVPACPAVAFVPASVEQQPVVGWNAGANSIVELDGDLHTVFTMPHDAGVVIGLRSGRALQTNPALIEHGLYFTALAGVDLVHVIEGGVARTSAVSRAVSDTFEIRRLRGQVTYWQNNVLLYASAVISTGAKVVNTCMYASGDEV